MIGLIGCFVGIVFTAIGPGSSSALWSVVDFIFLAAFAYMLRFGLVPSHMEMPSKMDLIEEEERKSAGGIIKPFAYIFCYALLLNLAVFMAAVGLHEGGHLLVGNLMGCEGGRVVLVDLLNPNMAGPYTEMRCPVNAQLYVLGLSGFVLIVPFGLMFLLLRVFPEKNFFYVVLGLSLVLAGLDMLLVVPEPLVSHAMLIIGALLICVGEVFLINDYIGLAKMKGANAVLASSQFQGASGSSQSRSRRS
jgi:hypothetical protein